MLRNSLLVASVVLVMAGALCGVSWGAEADAAATPAPKTMVEQIKNPVDWFNWGFDLRVREEYMKNAFDLMSEYDDDRNVIRVRGRIWTAFGPFLKSDELGGGLRLVTRLTAEPRYYIQRSDFAPLAVDAQEWEEIAFDNLFLDWQDIGSLPISARVGRQDVVKGRGWLILDGTPLDGSRTIYSDAAVVTLRHDEWKSSLDFILMDNKAKQTRLQPISEDHKLVSEYDLRLFSAYLTSAILDPMQFHLYYIYADEDLVKSGSLAPHRTIHTVGGLVQGRAWEDWDYYVESGYQWGSISDVDISAYGVNSDIGYTFSDVRMTPRVHAGYEYLSGDDPKTSGTYEGWNALLGRWPQWSEIFAARYAFEGGMPANYSNLHRAVFGVSAKPIPKMITSFDYMPLWADRHVFGTSFTPAPPIPMPFGNGYFRGQLFKAVAKYQFNKYLDGELWGEYFKPSSFYDGLADDALFFRWQLNFTF